MALKSKTITASRPGPHLLITGGVHGDEWEPMLAARRLIERFDKELESGSVTLIPIVNESAFRQATRHGEDGLDLARICPGNRAGTATEQAAAELSAFIEQADYYIDMHTAGIMGDILPLAGYMLHDDRSVLDTQRRMARAFNLSVVWGTNADLDGRSLSVARDADVPAIYVEFGGGAHCRRATVSAYVSGCLNVAGLLGMLPRRSNRSNVRYVVEDARPNAGHLQEMCVAPMAGFWEPNAQVGQPIRKGEPMGRISDSLGTNSVEVPADQDGLVVFTRTIPSVAEGTPLGGVLPIDRPGEIRYEA